MLITLTDEEIAKTRKETAIHEAGHAIFYWLRNCRYEIDMKPEQEEYLGLVKRQEHVFSKQEAIESMLCFWGGIIAEAKFTDECHFEIYCGGGARDYECITGLAEKFFPDREYEILNLSEIVAARIINRFWKKIEKIAALLEHQDHADSSDIQKLIGSYDLAKYHEKILLPALRKLKVPAFTEEFPPINL